MHKQSKFWLGVCLAIFFSVFALESEAEAGRRNRIMQSWERQQASQTPWNGAYGHQTTGAPIALIVPPRHARCEYSTGEFPGIQFRRSITSTASTRPRITLVEGLL